MLLAIDAGNTNLVFGLWDGEKIKRRWRISTEARRTGDEYAVWFHQLLELEQFDRGEVNAVIIGSVVPHVLHHLKTFARSYFGVEPMLAGVEPASWPIPLEVVEPRSVGADRVLNAMAAHALYEGDLIVVDFGTATTLDAVDFNGAYQGGIIAPGVNLSIDALVAAAARLPRISIEPLENETVIGRTTEDQMHIGIYWGYLAMLEGLVARMRAEIGRPAKVIGTGGLAALFDRRSDLFDAIEPDLTIHGLVRLYEMAVKSE